MSRLDLRDLGVRIDRVQILHQVTLLCAPGSFVGLIGPNGSGKSTALKTIYRSIPVTSGAVLLDGDDIVRDLHPRETARRVAAMVQDAGPPPAFTVREVVATGRTPHHRSWGHRSSNDDSIVDNALADVGMAAHGCRAFGEMSGGERQRILLAAALAQQPTVLILDEPTNHLDISTQFALLSLVRGLGITVVAALHDLNLAAAFCDRLAVLHDGRLVADGTPDEVLTPRMLRQVFGINAHCGTHPVTGRRLLAFHA